MLAIKIPTTIICKNIEGRNLGEGVAELVLVLGTNSVTAKKSGVPHSVTLIFDSEGWKGSVRVPINQYVSPVEKDWTIHLS